MTAETDALRLVPEPRAIDTAPRDGTMLRLWVRYPEGASWTPLDDARESWTIGFNNFDNTEEDRWQVVGWCWSHDHLVEAANDVEVLGWLPFHGDAAPAVQPAAGREEAALPGPVTDEWAERFCDAVNWSPDGQECKTVEGEFRCVSFRDLAKGYILSAIATNPNEVHPPAQGSESGGEVERLRVLLDNLVIAQTLSREIRQSATDEARSYLYQLRQAALSQPGPASEGTT